MRLLLCFLLLLNSLAFADEPLLKPNDVIAVVGGEDMVVQAELGYLETLLQRALPKHQLKIRSLAWEGDTVFEQHRDLNYPTLEAQLEKMGATVVLAQFGQSESLGGKERLSDFIAAYEKLIARLAGGKQRRVIVIEPQAVARFPARDEEGIPAAPESVAYAVAIEEMCSKRGITYLHSYLSDYALISLQPSIVLRDGIHLNSLGQGVLAGGIADELLNPVLDPTTDVYGGRDKRPSPELEKLREMVVSKNRLWFHYTRPQNWAFLAGDRTNQPSSRDHVDRTKRWFPEELERFVPMIEAKDKEIWDFAAKLNP